MLTPTEDPRICYKEFLLEKIRRAYERRDKAEISRLVLEAMHPEVLEDRVIRLAGFDFDVTGTIYSESKAQDVLQGWKLLVEESIPMDLYLKAFYVSTLISNFDHVIEDDSKVDEETYLSIIIEPVVLELLRLSYWIYICKEALNESSFSAKFEEVKSNLIFRNLNEFRQNLDRNLRIFDKLMGDPSIPYWERELYVRELMELVEADGQFRSNISSYVPEFMSAALMKRAGLEIDFIPTADEKRCDFHINPFKVEVKTFLDRTNPRIKLEESLSTEILETLKRKKTIRDIEDSLSKKSDITLIFLTFSSLGSGFANYTFNRVVDFSLEKALRDSNSIAHQNQTTPHHIEYIPVITFTTAIDYSNCVYKMFFFTVPFPVKKKEDGNYELIPDRLSIDLPF